MEKQSFNYSARAVVGYSLIVAKKKKKNPFTCEAAAAWTAAAATVKLSLMFYSNNKKLHSHLHSHPAPIISARAREDLILHVLLILCSSATQ